MLVCQRGDWHLYGDGGCWPPRVAANRRRSLSSSPPGRRGGILWPNSGPWHAGRLSSSDSKVYEPGRPACASQAGPAAPERVRCRALVGKPLRVRPEKEDGCPFIQRG
eukprot:7795671-Pyramimonas_sp.AAC.1